jgi:hypothetical protein|tara:strand:+ start:908 stop:1081 length:174 start_codon:yes stop_codon:yes gene_type:complete
LIYDLVASWEWPLIGFLGCVAILSMTAAVARKTATKDASLVVTMAFIGMCYFGMQLS